MTFKKSTDTGKSEVRSSGDDRLADITPRERDVLELIGQGLSTAAIAEHLHRSEKTIKSHRRALGQKLGVSNRVELARIAIESGLAPLEWGSHDGSEKREQEFREEASKRERLEQVFSSVEAGITLQFDDDFFQNLVRHLAEAMKVRCVFVGRIMAPKGDTIGTIATWLGDGPGENFEFPIVNTPCEEVIRKGMLFCSCNLRSIFKIPQAVKLLPVDSYLGMALYDRQGQAIGVMALIHDGPMDEVVNPRTILKIFADRATSHMQYLLDQEQESDQQDRIELEVKQHDEELIRSNEELREKLASQTDMETSLLDEKNQLQKKVSDHARQIEGLSDLLKREVNQKLRIESGIKLLVQTASLTGEGYLLAIVDQLARTLSVRHVFISEILSGGWDEARMIAVCSDSGLKPGDTYKLAGTPCQTAITQKCCFYRHNVQQIFPDDPALVDLNAESYFGIALFDSEGQPLGVIFIIHDQPVENPDYIEAILRIVSARTAAEMDRLHLASRMISNEAHQKAFFTSTLDPLVVIDIRGIIQFASDSVQRDFGWLPGEIQGKNVNLLMSEPYHSHHDSYLKRYQETGETNIMGATRELVGLRKDGSVFPIDLTVWRVDAPGQDEPLFTGIIRDITLRKKAEEELRNFANSEHLMRCELNHRVRNNLSSLISLIGLSRKSTTDIDEYAQAIRNRVQAMANVHTFLTKQNWSDSSIRNLVEAVVPEEAIGRINFRGPDDFRISANKAGALATVIHELVINSLKHGSLASEAGRVELVWNLMGEEDESRLVELIWKESGGAPIDQQPIPGTGTEIIEGLIKSDLQGRSSFTYPKIGACHRFEIRFETEDALLA